MTTVMTHVIRHDMSALADISDYIQSTHEAVTHDVISQTLCAPSPSPSPRWVRVLWPGI